MALLDVQAIDVAHGEIATLREVSLQVEPGEVVAILGANGAGKTTLLRAISGLMRPACGRIVFDGRDITRLPAHRVTALGLSHVPEGRGMLPELTVAENLRLGSYLRGLGASAEDLERMLDLFPILRARHRQLAGMLSGGEQQMLAIARGLVGRPRLLMIDELSLGLAPKITEELMKVLTSFGRGGPAILMVEQSASLALRHAERVYVLSNGRVAQSGSAREMAGDPAVLHAYLGHREAARPAHR